MQLLHNLRNMSDIKLLEDDGVRNGLTVFITSSANEEEGSPLHRLSASVANYTSYAERVFPELLSIYSTCHRSIKQ